MGKTNSNCNAPSIEILECLSTNWRFVYALIEGPSRKSELATQLDVSKSTIYRKMKELQKLCVVEKTNQGYGLTPAGRYFADLLRQSESMISNIYQAASITDDLSRVELPEYNHWDNVDIYQPGIHSQKSTVDKVCDFFDSGAGITLFGRCISPWIDSIGATQSCHTPRDFEIIVDYNTYETDYCISLLTDIASNSTRGIYVYPERVQYSLVMSRSGPRKVLVVMFDEADRISGGLEFSNEATLDWCSMLVEAYRDEAFPLTCGSDTAL